MTSKNDIAKGNVKKHLELYNSTEHSHHFMTSELTKSRRNKIVEVRNDDNVRKNKFMKRLREKLHIKNKK